MSIQTYSDDGLSAELSDDLKTDTETSETSTRNIFKLLRGVLYPEPLFCIYPLEPKKCNKKVAQQDAVTCQRHVLIDVCATVSRVRHNTLLKCLIYS